VIFASLLGEGGKRWLLMSAISSGSKAVKIPGPLLNEML
jgi:hypothetical protein